MPDRDVFIISAVRTAIGPGEPGGGLHTFQPLDLAVPILKAAVKRAGLQASRVEDLILGSSQGGNLAHLAALKAGFPVSAPAVQVSRMAGSGQQALHFGAQAILAGDADIILVGGFELASQPLPRAEGGLDQPGEAAERMAAHWSLGREALDEYASQSHLRAKKAVQGGYFDGQILPIESGGEGSFRVDESAQPAPDPARLAVLEPVVRNGVITSGNLAQPADGAAALLLASAQAVGKLNLVPMARIDTRVVVAAGQTLPADGLIKATRLALMRSGLSMEEIDLFEIDESSAALSLVWAHELSLDLHKVNPQGGMLAYGNPLGATGAILMTRLVHELEHRQARYGLQCLCCGDGMAMATIIERV